MSAPKGNTNALGNTGGKSKNDRELAARVRSLALTHIEKILADTYADKEFQKAVILKLASTVLPRLNEHSGNDGEPIAISWSSQSPTNQDSGPQSSTTAQSVG